MIQINLCGVRIDGVTRKEVVEIALAERGEVCTVVTPNAVMLEQCRQDARYATLLNRATLSLPDGMGVLRAARKKGIALPERVAGIDFGEALLARSAEDGLRVFFLGGAKGVAQEAARVMTLRYPKLSVCGTYCGYFDRTGEENERLLARLQALAPDILLVCLGFPLQEEWIFQNVQRLPFVRVMAGLGGSLDVWAGEARRAPQFVQRCGLEWAWRMLREPRRLRQLPTLLRFFMFGART